MNNFKEQLKQELRTDAPFTVDMKQRIVINKQPKTAPAKKFNWQVSVISLAFVLILGFVVMLQVTPNGATASKTVEILPTDQPNGVTASKMVETLPTDQPNGVTASKTVETLPTDQPNGVTASKTVETLPTDHNELFDLLQQNETVLPIIEPNGQLVIQPTIGYLMGKQFGLSSIPMVIEPDTEIKIGDYIAYYHKKDIIVAPVFGVAGDKIQTSHGQVTLNGNFLALPGAVAPIVFEDAEQENIFKFYFRDLANYHKTKMRYIDVDLDPLHEDEYAVYKNEVGQTVSVINDAQIAGKVIGLKNLEPTFTLTTDEQSLYDAFKENYDLSVLKGTKPLTIAKMYVLAESEGDYETKFAFKPTNERPTQSEIVKYIQDKQKIRGYYSTKKIQRLVSAYNYNGIEGAQFEQSSEIEGTIKFTPTYGDVWMLIRMIKNDQGIWQPTTK
ncbi:hypothetical protein [Lysinibacillus sphaericus]|uniref:Uncharacterized protein n=1 Tax=Lysinibacillus sphaericus OT4b.31 TaxID=1285586 RepID=R7ZF53_LYSSH|nr:hypothetical protein [Lysinibacillus sphaericus]EON72629.1 hypothetical protein H131_10828 [Lysinibacillus sphaericus OT4b.31]